MRYDDLSIEVRQTIGANIRRLRLKNGLSQKRFAAMTNIDRGYLNQLERGRANVTVDLLVKIANGLDIPIWHLFYSREYTASNSLSEELAQAAMAKKISSP